MNTPAIIETLRLLKTVTFDGNIPSKQVRDHLVRHGYVERFEGYNMLTPKGIELCKMLLLLGDE